MGGNTRVTLTLDRAAIAPGTRVRVGTRLAGEVDVIDLRQVKFTLPEGTAGLVPVALERDAEDPEDAPESFVVGTFSYDLPFGSHLTLPGFPPLEASEIKLDGSTLYVGVSANVPGLEHLRRAAGGASHPQGQPADVGPGARPGREPSAGAAGGGAGHHRGGRPDPARPFTVGRVATSGTATGVRIEGTRAYVSVTEPSSGSGQIQVLDLTKPTLDVVTSEARLLYPEDGLALDLGPDRFYVLTSKVNGESGDGLRLSIYDRAGVKKGWVTVDASLTSTSVLLRSRVAVRAGRAYVTVGQRVYVFDVSPEREAAPVALQSAQLAAEGRGLTWAGGSLWVSTRDATRSVVEVPPAGCWPWAPRP